MNRHRFRIRARALVVLATLAMAVSAADIRAAESGSANTRLLSPTTGGAKRHFGPAKREYAAPAEGKRVAHDTPGKTTKIGLLLPLTGRNADLGKAMQNAATVALFDRYADLPPQFASTKVELLPKDTGDTPEQAVKAMQSALDDRVDLVIGPLFSDATAAIAPLATEKNIPVISFSNHAANARPGIYTFGFSPQEQTARVLTFAVKKGKGRIAVLAPNSSLGETVVNAAKAALNGMGTKPVAVARYAPQGVGIDQALNALVPNEDAPNFDALLLPEGGMAMPTILRAMEARGIRLPKVQLLGTGIWDDANLIRRANLDGGWLASSPPASTALFEKRFAVTYNYTPPRIASLAYDAVSLAVTLATSGRGFSEEALTNPSGFTGPANGNFRLRADGTVERSLAVLRISGAGFQVLDLAPGAFTAPAAAK